LDNTIKVTTIHGEHIGYCIFYQGTTILGSLLGPWIRSYGGSLLRRPHFVTIQLSLSHYS